jgi:hypothetical protein
MIVTDDNDNDEEQCPLAVPQQARTSSDAVTTESSLLFLGDGFWDELVASTDVLFQGKLTLLLALGPLAVIGDATGILGGRDRTDSVCGATVVLYRTSGGTYQRHDRGFAECDLWECAGIANIGGGTAGWVLSGCAIGNVGEYYDEYAFRVWRVLFNWRAAMASSGASDYVGKCQCGYAACGDSWVTLSGGSGYFGAIPGGWKDA